MLAKIGILEGLLLSYVAQGMTGIGLIKYNIVSQLYSLSKNWCTQVETDMHMAHLFVAGEISNATFNKAKNCKILLILLLRRI